MKEVLLLIMFCAWESEVCNFGRIALCLGGHSSSLGSL